ncbi:nucleoside hydrolase [uncultured Amnibacterium sp.]|uniref:nucleoside hydrolase n=1 Tax=uncultured Amnibacterium sp. TaxID=1631851 RepID=UPI0035CB6E7B
MPVPVIIDCDPGHDDVFAIWLAAGSPGLDVRAITTVAGNVDVEQTTLNALAACSVAGIDVPVARGADRPRVREPFRAADVHGPNGLGGIERPAVTVPLDDRSALDLIDAVLTDSSEPVSIVALGPLTNIAALVASRPHLQPSIERVVWMGGSTERGNSTPYAEFNAFSDPHAADVVLRSGVPFTMVGLNVTHQTAVDDDLFARLVAIDTDSARFGVRLLIELREAFQTLYGRNPPIHDAVAMAVALEPGIVTSTRTRVDVELEGTQTLGATSVDLHDRLHREANADVALRLDVDRFWDVLVAALAALR